MFCRFASRPGCGHRLSTCLRRVGGGCLWRLPCRHACALTYDLYAMMLYFCTTPPPPRHCITMCNSCVESGMPQAQPALRTSPPPPAATGCRRPERVRAGAAAAAAPLWLARPAAARHAGLHDGVPGRPRALCTGRAVQDGGRHGAVRGACPCRMCRPKCVHACAHTRLCTCLGILYMLCTKLSMKVPVCAACCPMHACMRLMCRTCAIRGCRCGIIGCFMLCPAGFSAAACTDSMRPRAWPRLRRADP